MSDLECSHCGGLAFTSRDYDRECGVYLFTDGDGEECATCGYPGSVVVDDQEDGSDVDIYWSESGADDARCNDPECESCSPQATTKEK